MSVVYYFSICFWLMRFGGKWHVNLTGELRDWHMASLISMVF